MNDEITFMIDKNPLRFFDLDEWLTNRDSQSRAKTPNIKSVFNHLYPDHLIVMEGILTEDDEWIDGTKYPAGSSFRLDGNSRIEVWMNSNTPVNISDIEQLYVIQYRAKTLKELESMYYRMNSVDASETTKDIYKGIYKSLKDDKGMPWQWKSSKFRGGEISMLMEYAATKLFPHRILSVKKAKSDGVSQTTSKVKITMRRKQMDQFAMSMRVLDHFIRQAELNKTEKVMRDNPLGAALLGFFWADGAEDHDNVKSYTKGMNPHVKQLITEQLTPMKFLKDTDQNNEVHMNFAGNRLLRDASVYDNSMDSDSIFQPTIRDRSSSNGAGPAYNAALCDILKIANSGLYNRAAPVVDTEKMIDKWVAKVTADDQLDFFSNPVNQRMVSNLVVSGFLPDDDEDDEDENEDS